MDFIQLLILQIIAHLLTDFTFQSDEESYEKNEFGFKSKFLIWHAIIAFILSWFCSLQLNFWPVALLIAILHYLTDGVKKQFKVYRWFRKNEFLIDQFIHISLLLLITLTFYRTKGIESLIELPFETRGLVIIAGFLFCSKPSNIIIREILNLFGIKFKNKVI